MNFYQVLGIAEDADHETVKAAYRALASKWHPDKHGCSAESTAMMQKINMAYNTLSDVSKRSQYDAERVGRGGVHEEAARRSRAHDAKKRREAEAKQKSDEAMKRTRQKAEESTRKTTKKTSRKKDSKASAEPQAAPKEAPKSTEAPKAEQSSTKRVFNPNRPCPICFGMGQIRVALGFQTAKVVCPQCSGIGS